MLIGTIIASGATRVGFLVHFGTIIAGWVTRADVLVLFGTICLIGSGLPLFHRADMMKENQAAAGLDE